MPRAAGAFAVGTALVPLSSGLCQTRTQETLASEASKKAQVGDTLQDLHESPGASASLCTPSKKARPTLASFQRLLSTPTDAQKPPDYYKSLSLPPGQKTPATLATSPTPQKVSKVSEEEAVLVTTSPKGAKNKQNAQVAKSADSEHLEDQDLVSAKSPKPLKDQDLVPAKSPKPSEDQDLVPAKSPKPSEDQGAVPAKSPKPSEDTGAVPAKSPTTPGKTSSKRKRGSHCRGSSSSSKKPKAEDMYSDGTYWKSLASKHECVCVACICACMNLNNAIKIFLDSFSGCTAIASPRMGSPRQAPKLSRCLPTQIDVLLLYMYCQMRLPCPVFYSVPSMHVLSKFATKARI